MSKQQTNSAKTGNRQTAKKIWIIAVVAVVAIVTMVILLSVFLKTPESKTVAANDTATSPTSSATIRNGDFAYYQKGTSYPYIADNWKKYTYKEGTASSRGFSEITANENTVMGVITVQDVKGEDDDDDVKLFSDVSADLAKYGVNVANPGRYTDEEGNSPEDYDVYMISNLTDYSASIYSSSSFSVPSSTSVRITVWLKTVGVTSEDWGAFLMLNHGSATNSNSTAESYSGTQYWYAHEGVQGTSGINTDGEWKAYELYIFNQTSSSKSVYFNAGLGNVYTGETSKGTLFIDDVTYETVTANEVRKYSGSEKTNVYTLEGDSNENVTTALAWQGTAYSVDQSALEEYFAYDAATAGLTDTERYVSPFNIYNEADKIDLFRIANDGHNLSAVTIRSDNFTVEENSLAKHYHVSLWLRVIPQNDQILARANVYLMNTADDTPVSGGSFTNLSTSTDIADDANNGWAQYHFYLEPSDLNDTQLYLLVSLGDRNGYSTYSNEVPDGLILLTEPVIEDIKLSEYKSASSGSATVKVSFAGSTASIDVTNGSFGNLATNSDPEATLYQPTNWTPVFANAVEIFLNGNDNVTVPQGAESVSAGVEKNSADAPIPDDEVKAVLKITNVDATSYGYLSGSISLSKNTVYALSVLVKADASALPNVYVLRQNDDKQYEIWLQQEANASGNLVQDSVYRLPADGNGYTRYYFVIATGDTASTVKVALFNGKIDASVSGGTATGVSSGTVWFDQVTLTTLGTYKRDKLDSDSHTNDLYKKDADGNLLKDDDGNYILDADAVAEMTYTAESGFASDVDEVLDSQYANVVAADERTTDVDQPTVSDESDSGNTSDDSNDSGSSVDWALLVSIISSTVLLAALIIVIVFKFVFRKKK